MLFSATQTTVEDLAKMSFRRKPLYVGVDTAGPRARTVGLSRAAVVVLAEKAPPAAFTFFKKNCNGHKRAAHSMSLRIVRTAPPEPT
jgi:ATP-dependent RNA helicase DDX18/HAS1